MAHLKVTASLPTGWYNLFSPEEKEPSLVYLYTNPDTKERGFGYNIKDGAGFQPLWDVREECWVEPVTFDKVDSAFEDKVLSMLANSNVLQTQSNSMVITSVPMGMSNEEVEDMMQVLNRAFSVLMSRAGHTNVHLIILPEKVNLASVEFTKDVTSMCEHIREAAEKLREKVTVQ